MFFWSLSKSGCNKEQNGWHHPQVALSTEDLQWKRSPVIQSPMDSECCCTNGAPMAFNGAPPAEQQLVELEQPLALVRSSLIKARLRLRLYNTFASLPLKTFSLVCSMFFLNSLLFIFTQIVEVNTFQIAHVATGANLQTVFSLVLLKQMFALLLVLSCVCFQKKIKRGRS